MDYVIGNETVKSVSRIWVFIIYCKRMFSCLGDVFANPYVQKGRGVFSRSFCNLCATIRVMMASVVFWLLPVFIII